jgi:hypothetical protein
MLVGRRRRRVRGRAATVVVAVVVLGIALGVSGCVPGLRSLLGLPGGYAVTLLRSGTLYTEARPGSFLWGSPPYQSTTALASDGDTIVISFDVTVQTGRAIISVVPGLWGGDAIHTEHVTASRVGSIRVATPAGGIYRVTASYVFSFRGVARIDWHME